MTPENTCLLSGTPDPPRTSDFPLSSADYKSWVARTLPFLKHTGMCLLFLLLIIPPSLSAPVPEPLLIRTELNNGQLHFGLPRYITELMTDTSCSSLWHINDTVVASEDGFVYPVISATTDSITTDTCHPSLVFHISCPSRDFDRKLQCSCAPMKAPGGLSSDAYKLTVPYEWLGTVITMRLLTL